jgi:hypothetical protein
MGALAGSAVVEAPLFDRHVSHGELLRLLRGDL